ncbi:MAG: 2-phospho-L-lactate transferase [Candidatus Dadabacteria bacterium]|nr:2-phospho-L-lactate transferase [Candidatus Dadabacteria bacterium]NIS08718.1 2-phospho-L-lactate transferase [Candidatus Dadabacteria bacterium]NIV42602.1 2-phospho-L-lactate transferase [Candidatus Dadabacteria bacterium]NIX15404.1 2-phospho-L-lactate transferase [Candidatus Dadabacteria bacterium]NIY22067.1 2-phospho-L-lactate transferase [Candidatus Dadabacteria bacterium]
MITALGGGVGAAKFLSGLIKLGLDEKINIIVNTADDITIGGLRICPDIDTIVYTLSGNVDKKKKWGLKGDSFNCLQALSRFGIYRWFNLGDKDLATHLYRTHLRSLGYSYTDITSKIAKSFGLDGVNVLPMSDSDVETWISTDSGELHFQEYLVREKMLPEVKSIYMKGIEDAVATDQVIDSIQSANTIILCPSNPIISIGPILKVGGVRDAIKKSGAKKVAISPLVGGLPLKGPADILMKAEGLEVSSTAIAMLYKDFLDEFVIDTRDSAEAPGIEKLGIKTTMLDTVMQNEQDSVNLAQQILGA